MHSLAQLSASSFSDSLFDDNDEPVTAAQTGFVHAQLQSQSASPTCDASVKRNKANVVDFWSILGGSAQFTDSDFPAD